MEVLIPYNSHSSLDFDFDFNSARTSPHVSPPSTPKRFGQYYFSAPTSPSHLSQFYRDFDHDDQIISTVPFNWEEKPGTPKSPPAENNSSFSDDFAFDVSEDNWDETASVTADELFDGGLIKPLKPPPRLHLPAAARISESGKTHKSSNKNEIDDDPFAVAARNAAKLAAPPQRGRELGVDLRNSSSRRAARSLSPMRDPPSSSTTTVCSTLSSTVKGQYRKWRFRDFFLFRSASEGRAADKDKLRKHTAAIKHSSFRGVGSPAGSGSGSGSRRRGPVEQHYTVNRAVSEDMKKKTFLPYKQGILGRLAFNPAVHALANGFGLSRK